MQKKHVQAELAPHLYEALRRAAERHGKTVKATLHDAVASYVRQEEGDEDPFFGIIGLVKGRGKKTNWAKDHDAIIYDEEA